MRISIIICKHQAVLVSFRVPKLPHLIYFFKQSSKDDFVNLTYSLTKPILTLHFFSQLPIMLSCNGERKEGATFH